MIGSEGTLGFISEITYHTVPELRRQGERADPVRRARDRVPRRDAPEERRRSPRSSWSTVPRCARWRTSRACPTALRALGPHGAALLVETRAADGGGARRTDPTRSRPRSPASRTFEPAALLDRRGRMRALLERAQGHVPVGRRDAQGRHHRDHRGRRLPGAAPGRGHARPAAPARGARLSATRSSSAMRSKATCTSCSRRTSTRAAEVERYRGFMDALCRDGRREVRRLAQGRARHRPQHRALRRARMGRARPIALMRRDQARCSIRTACSIPA